MHRANVSRGIFRAGHIDFFTAFFHGGRVACLVGIGVGLLHGILIVAIVIVAGFATAGCKRKRCGKY